MKDMVRSAVRRLGLDIVRYQAPSGGTAFPPDLSAADKSVLERVGEYTMTGLERQISVVQAVRYLAQRHIDGCFVECGVWRGGSSMAAALTLAQEGDTSRHLYLYDTFEGMTPPTDKDRKADGTLARTLLDQNTKHCGGWCVAGLDDVQENMQTTGYPQERVHYVKGPVEKTLPAQLPEGPIVLLRLDTDWYESTRHELIHLFPLLCSGGILIIDDYGHWEGARKAVDEYMAEQNLHYFMHRIDYTGRLIIKQ